LKPSIYKHLAFPFEEYNKVPFVSWVNELKSRASFNYNKRSESKF